MADVSFKSIWEDLSQVDCSEHTETKGNGKFALTFLSWAWAWGILMEKYPEASFEFLDDEHEDNGTVMVNVAVDIHGNQREMWLPVMDHKNASIKHPTTREISDAKMRCLVKCLALFGLGHYIYAGEDIPRKPEVGEAEAETKELSDSQREKVRAVRVTVEACIETSESVGDLEAHYKTNKPLLNEIRGLNEEAYKSLVDQFMAKKKELSNNG